MEKIKHILKKKEERNRVMDVAFSPDGSKIVAKHSDGRIIIHNFDKATNTFREGEINGCY